MLASLQTLPATQMSLQNVIPFSTFVFTGWLSQFHMGLTYKCNGWPVHLLSNLWKLLLECQSCCEAVRAVRASSENLQRVAFGMNGRRYLVFIDIKTSECKRFCWVRPVHSTSSCARFNYRLCVDVFVSRTDKWTEMDRNKISVNWEPILDSLSRLHQQNN